MIRRSRLAPPQARDYRHWRISDPGKIGTPRRPFEIFRL
jgi:hypothetical protein